MRGVLFTAAALAAAAAQAQSFHGVCALLSREEVAQVEHVSISDGVPLVNNRDVSSCSYRDRLGGAVEILLRPHAAAGWISEQTSRMLEGVRLGTYREVAGIGNRSFLRETQKTAAVLCVFGQDYYLQISLYRIGEGSARSGTLRSLALRALARLRAGAVDGPAAGLQTRVQLPPRLY